MWDKISKVAKKAGAKTIYGVLLLYYASIDSNISLSDKVKIYGTLGYFILPLDLVPDAMPIVGYGDDFAAIMLAIKSISGNITPEVRNKAQSKLASWFGEIDKDVIQYFNRETGLTIQMETEEYNKAIQTTQEYEDSENFGFKKVNLIEHNEHIEDNEVGFIVHGEPEEYKEDISNYSNNEDSGNLDFNEVQYIEDYLYYAKINDDEKNKILNVLRESYGITETRASVLEKIANK